VRSIFFFMAYIIFLHSAIFSESIFFISSLSMHIIAFSLTSSSDISFSLSIISMARLHLVRSISSSLSQFILHSFNISMVSHFLSISFMGFLSPTIFIALAMHFLMHIPAPLPLPRPLPLILPMPLSRSLRSSPPFFSCIFIISPTHSLTFSRSMPTFLTHISRIFSPLISFPMSFSRRRVLSSSSLLQ